MIAGRSGLPLHHACDGTSVSAVVVDALLAAYPDGGLLEWGEIWSVVIQCMSAGL